MTPLLPIARTYTLYTAAVYYSLLLFYTIELGAQITTSSAMNLKVHELRDLGFTSDDYPGVSYCQVGSAVLIHQPTLGDSLKFCLYDASTARCDSMYVNMTGIVPEFSMTSPEFMDISASDKYLVLLAFKGIIVFALQPDVNNLRFMYSAPLPLPFSKAGVCGDKILLGMCYNHRAEKGVKPTCLAVYDIPTRRIVRSINPDFAGIELTHFSPSQWIDFSGSNILFADASKYSVRIYDTTLTLISRIDEQPTVWKAIDTKALTAIAKKYNAGNTKASLPALTAYMESHPSNIIRSAGFIGSERIYISYTPADSIKSKNFERLYDIWSRDTTSSDRWIASARGVMTSCVNRKDTCSKRNFTDYIQFAKAVTLPGSHLGVVVRTPPLQYIYEEGIPYSTLEANTQEYFRNDNPLRYTFLRYSFE
ncbi:MAG: hypothetical protein ACK45R_00495 [Candidatus Kapaibacterium sp.]